MWQYSIFPLFLDRCTSGQLHVPAVLPPGKGLRCPLDTRLGGTQSRPGREGEQKSLFPCQEWNPGHPSCSQSLFSISTGKLKHLWYDNFTVYEDTFILHRTNSTLLIHLPDRAVLLRDTVQSCRRLTNASALNTETAMFRNVGNHLQGYEIWEDNIRTEPDLKARTWPEQAPEPVQWWTAVQALLNFRSVPPQFSTLLSDRSWKSPLNNLGKARWDDHCKTQFHRLFEMSAATTSIKTATIVAQIRTMSDAHH
jgi:hypothetical protein